MAPLAWPAWTADRQPPHHPLTAGAPACTVFGEGETLDEARNCVNERAAQMRRILDGTV